MLLDKGKLHGLHNKLLLTLLHSEQPKLSGPRVLTILSATGLKVYTVTEKMSILIPHESHNSLHLFISKTQEVMLFKCASLIIVICNLTKCSNSIPLYMHKEAKN